MDVPRSNLLLVTSHKSMPSRLWFLLLSAAVLCLLSCASPQELTVFRGHKMGTSYQVKVADHKLSDQRLFEFQLAVEKEFDGIDRKMSTYRNDSEVSYFNELSGGESLTVSPETLDVFKHARWVSEATSGAFDITVGSLVDVWGFGAGNSSSGHLEVPMPTEDEVMTIRSQFGWQFVHLDEATSTISKSKNRPFLRCDLSAIAKGYAVDRAADVLGSMGVDDYLIELGGEIRTSGLNEQGKPWVVAIERPLSSEREPHRLLRLGNSALATSGDYRRFYEKDGRRYSHTIDPRTGRPVTHSLASVSVVEALCVRADAYATALMVLGEVEGFRFAVDHGLAALFLIRNEKGNLEEKTTPMFDARF